MIEPGKTVKVHYKGTLDDGSVFDSSEGREPLSFVLGSGQVIAGFDKAIQGMSVGETQTVNIPCAEAYGEASEDMIAVLEHDQFPPEIQPEVGLMLQLQTEQGPIQAVIVEMTDEGVRVDANHRLAGEDLTFELTVVEVE
ncbi:MAG: FKBP-type peptidyl-prolyl cis-trans isomerase [Planctomycetota bacterium]|jgi:peptidylprolyl isomerase